MPSSIHLRRPFTAAALLSSLLAACSSSPRATPAEHVDRQDQDLYGLGSLATPWPQGRVPVCFADPMDHPELQGLIPGILFTSWSSAANITFTGFGPCSGGNEVTLSFVSGTNGATSTLGYGRPAVSVISDDTRPGRTHFIYEVIHELGHALGFAHEMKRPDNWPGGVQQQCPQTPGNDISQYLPQPGGLNLTPSYDPNSIMNYCDPNKNNTTQLSVGDVLAASSANAYGPSVCTFADRATQCSWTRELHAESTFKVPTSCPSTTGWTFQTQSPSGVWSNPPNACTDGSQVGTCSPNAVSATSWVVGWQAEGAVGAGPAIGTNVNGRMCDAFSNCTPAFRLSITDCDTKTDQLYLNPGNDPLEVSQGSTGTANVLMVGPWVQGDGGFNAVGNVEEQIPGTAAYLSPGTTVNGEGVLQLYISASLSAATGTYALPIDVRDVSTGIKVGAAVYVHVSACTPSTAAEVCNGLFANGCGSKAVGCGLSVDCGTCSAGSACSSGFCCPDGTTYSTATNECESNTPTTCPSGTALCPDTGTCLTQKQCDRVSGGGCTGTHCF